MFVDLILPLSLSGTFSYEVPSSLQSKCVQGKRAIVQFGRKRIYSAIIKTVHDNKPQDYDTKLIIDIIDDSPLVTGLQLEFWDWMADYYMCTLGEVYKAALPSGLRLTSSTIISYNADFFSDDANYSDIKFTNKEIILLDALREKKQLSLDEINELLSLKNSISHIESLSNKSAVLVEETLEKDFKYKQERFLKLNDEIANDEELNNVLDNLKRASKQQEALSQFLDFSDFDSLEEVKLVNYSKFIKKHDISAATIKALETKGILISEYKNTSRLFDNMAKTQELYKLNSAQKVACSEINEHFKTKATVLLHGITSSGKTEIYIHLINSYIQKGQQVLYLLPEIALSVQIVERLKRVFGNRIGVYHSRYTDSERVEVWKNIIGQDENFSQYRVILGVRSALFLPFTNLGLIIIDEEHENTYKQFDPAPRYQARDSALMLAKFHDAKTLLGSATPSIESYYNASIDKFALVELNKRHSNVKLPTIIISDIKEARRKKEMYSHFSSLLLSHIKTTLDNKEQVILFQNRRGFSSYLECHACGWIPKCEHCDVSLTYHKYTNQLVCHYCGYSYTIMSNCKECKDTDVRMRGFGTERIEDELQLLFPDTKIGRLDIDTARGKKRYLKIISDFENGTTDILVGTQMISKGLDFDNVTLVGILDANQMLHYPNFRAYERTYQLIAQVGGRAGRRKKQGKVIIQTVSAGNPIIEFVKLNDYKALYKSQIYERMTFKYPPFNRLITITLKHKKKDLLDSVSQKYCEWLKQKSGMQILGPEDPVIGRIHNLYLKVIIVKIEKASQAKAYKNFILQVSAHLLKQKNCASIKIVYDVDSYS